MKPSPFLPFTRPALSGRELRYMQEAISGQISGGGTFTKRCTSWLEAQVGCDRALLTHSCTAALEMAALLLDIAAGDEIIMPSYTFVSTANAFVLRGAVPVFVDIREDTLNIDEKRIEEAITPRTRAIVAVHYAGVGCDMDVLCAIARRHGLQVVEDAAQGLMAEYKGRPLGSIGALGALSFHETKNVVSGEGGALLVNDQTLSHRAEVMLEKGTDRSRFLRGMVDKYTWQDVGSSFLPSEIIAAFLAAQLEDAQSITDRRLALWQHYHAQLASLEQDGRLRRPIVPSECRHNGHMYYILVPDGADRQALIDHLAAHGVRSVFHYIPLHDSPAGKRYGRAVGDMPVTRSAAGRLLRLPLFPDLGETDVERVVGLIRQSIA